MKMSLTNGVSMWEAIGSDSGRGRIGGPYSFREMLLVKPCRKERQKDTGSLPLFKSPEKEKPTRV